MASRPVHTYELIKLADKLQKDYYPLAEVLCRNALVQSEWLHEHSDSTIASAYLSLCDDLSNKVGKHLAMSKDVLFNIRHKDTVSADSFNSYTFKNSQKAIQATLLTLKEEEAVKNVTEWNELHDNLRMKLRVLNNLLTELFYIEDTQLIPLLEKNTPVSN